jgi:hypothetical protein
LENFLNQYRATTDDDVYWVVTCPTRCQNADWFLDKPYLSNAIDSLLYQSLSRASDLSIKHNIKIHLIGGLCDLDTISTKTYPQLDFVVPSWGRLLDKNYYCTRFMPDYWIELGTEIKKKQPNLLLEWLEMSGKISMKKQSWDRMSKSYFKTDRSHPDRDGHKKLRDHLWPQFAYKF